MPEGGFFSGQTNIVDITKIFNNSSTKIKFLLLDGQDLERV